MDSEHRRIPLIQFPPPQRPSLYARIRSYIGNDVFVSSPPMSPMDRETLNPCEKLARFGRIPWKLTVHAALVFTTTLMVAIWSQNDGLHIRHSLLHFHRTFLGVTGSDPADRRAEFVTSDELRKQIDSTIRAYWSIGDSSFTSYTICHNPLVFETERIAEGDTSVTTVIQLEPDSWDSNPHYQREVDRLDSSLRRIAVKGTVRDVFQGDHWKQCLRWSIDTVFDYGGTGVIVGSLEYGLTECSKSGDTNYSIPITVIALAILSVILCTKAEMGRLNRHGWWYVFNVASNFVQIGAALACMRLTRRMDVSDRFAVSGLAAMMAWICVIRYLRYFHIYYALIRTLSRAVPRCMRFVTGVFPILIGYALLGNCLFYQSAMFTSIGGSIATLFSLLNGDIIRDTFTDVGDILPFWGHVYLYTFLCLFIYVVLHIFISIVEEAYFSVKASAAREEELFDPNSPRIEMNVVADDSVSTLTPSPVPASSVGQYIVDHVRGEISVLMNTPEWESTYKPLLINVIR